MEDNVWTKEQTGWSQVHGMYRAVVVEDQASPLEPYTARLESTSGEVITRHPVHFRELEEAQEWALFLVTQYEPETETRWLESLTYCIKHLPGDLHPLHRQRLINLRDWVLDRYQTTPDPTVAVPPFNWTEHGPEYHDWVLDRYQTTPDPTVAVPPFNWTEHGPEYHSPTPHGLAVIVETSTRSPFRIGATSSYRALIRHASGVPFDCHQFSDFMFAEQSIREALPALSDPAITDSQLEVLHWTIEICCQSLPAYVHQLHRIRLSQIGIRVDEFLR